MITSPPYITRFEVLEKKSQQYCQKGIYHGVSYKSESFLVPVDSYLHNIINTNEKNKNINNNTINKINYNKKSLNLIGVSKSFNKTIVPTDSSHNISKFQFIPYEFRQSVNNTTTNAITDTPNTQNNIPVSNTTVGHQPDDSSSTVLITNEKSSPVSVIETAVTATTNDLTIKSTSTTAAINNDNNDTTSTIPSIQNTILSTNLSNFPDKILIKNKILLEEDIICITRGVDKIESFELKGVLSLQSQPHPSIFENKIIEKKSNPILTPFEIIPIPTTIIDPNIMKNPNLNNPISSLFDDIFLTTNDHINPGFGTNNISKVKKDCLQLNITMSGTPNSITHMDINKKFIQVIY